MSTMITSPMDGVASPPPYRRLSRPGPAPQSANELPAYTRSRRHTLAQPVARREPTEHVFQLMDGRKPWVVLKVYSSARSSKSLPTFFEKENINCKLEVRAGSGDSSIQAISATVKGRIITGSRSEDIDTFMSISQPIWTKSSEGSRSPSPGDGLSGSKLSGDCSWAFSIPLPRSINRPDGSADQLPETFSDPHCDASIQYDLMIKLSRGKLRSDTYIKTAFGYVPSSRPVQPSMLRQLAYQEGVPLPGPEADPLGWRNLPTIIAEGVVYRSRATEVQCTLSLAKPLSYTRGSVIPCSLSLFSIDPQALDLVSVPSSVIVCLQRTVRYYKESGARKAQVGWIDFSEDVATASWWHAASGTGHSRRVDPHVCNLEGEISIPKDLKPSANMGRFSISYSVVLRPFDVAGYQHSSNSDVMISEPVEITTMYARGPRPVAYSPPAYDKDVPSSPRDIGFVTTMNRAEAAGFTAF